MLIKFRSKKALFSVSKTFCEKLYSLNFNFNKGVKFNDFYSTMLGNINNLNNIQSSKLTDLLNKQDLNLTQKEINNFSKILTEKQKENVKLFLLLNLGYIKIYGCK